MFVGGGVVECWNYFLKIRSINCNYIYTKYLGRWRFEAKKKDFSTISRGILCVPEGNRRMKETGQGLLHVPSLVPVTIAIRRYSVVGRERKDSLLVLYIYTLAPTSI